MGSNSPSSSWRAVDSHANMIPPSLPAAVLAPGSWNAWVTATARIWIGLSLCPQMEMWKYLPSGNQGSTAVTLRLQVHISLGDWNHSLGSLAAWGGGGGWGWEVGGCNRTSLHPLSPRPLYPTCWGYSTTYWPLIKVASQQQWCSFYLGIFCSLNWLLSGMIYIQQNTTLSSAAFVDFYHD